MMRQVLLGAVAGVGVVLASSGALRAEETGVAGIHEWVRVGRKTCMADHFHSGVGKAATRAAAQRDAIQAWIDFTAWEYGGTWGRYSIAVSKAMSCERGAGEVSCIAEGCGCQA